MKILQKDVKENPDNYQAEPAKKFDTTQSAIFYALKRLGKTYKKNSISSQRRWSIKEGVSEKNKKIHQKK